MKHKKLFIYVSISLLFLLFLFSTSLFHHFNSPTRNTNETHKIALFICTLSAEEKEYLTNFFKLGVFASTFGYTLFGDKPMSIEMINFNEESRSVEGFDYMDLEHILGRYRLREGWEVWQRWAHLVLQRGFSIIYYPCHLNSNYIEVALINHENFLRTVNENLADFQAVLGEEISPQQILNEYINADGFIFHQIRNHDGLFGTILGYGRDNAWEYMMREGRDTLEPFFSLEQFLKGEPKDTQHILPPLFSVIPDSKETMKLQESYEKQRIEIDSIYQRDDFLEKVLLRLEGN